MATVKYRLDRDAPPATPQADLEKFDALDDADIDYSDLPELDDDFWAMAEIERPGHKPQVTMRVDPEVLAFFKGDDARGYTARMASVLRAYVLARQGKLR